jgi:hypothetical protein
MSGCRLRLADKREAWENRLFGGEEFLWNVLPFGSPDAAAYIQRRTAVAALIQRSQRKKLNTEDLACSRSFDNFWLAVGRESSAWRSTWERHPRHGARYKRS